MLALLCFALDACTAGLGSGRRGRRDCRCVGLHIWLGWECPLFFVLFFVFMGFGTVVRKFDNGVSGSWTSFLGADTV